MEEVIGKEREGEIFFVLSLERLFFFFIFNPGAPKKNIRIAPEEYYNRYRLSMAGTWFSLFSFQAGIILDRRLTVYSSYLLSTAHQCSRDLTVARTYYLFLPFKLACYRLNLCHVVVVGKVPRILTGAHKR